DPPLSVVVVLLGFEACKVLTGVLLVLFLRLLPVEEYFDVLVLKLGNFVRSTAYRVKSGVFTANPQRVLMSYFGWPYVYRSNFMSCILRKIPSHFIVVCQDRYGGWPQGKALLIARGE
ncbi:unnamed protein product, partial [Ectocarpus sp. 8 AP-2014]